MPCKETESPVEPSNDCNSENGKDENDCSSQDASPAEPPKGCNNEEGKNENDSSSQDASSEFVIPPGWARREYIAWRVEEEANQVSIGLARIGSMQPEHGFIVHLATVCDCGHGRNMKSKPDHTWWEALDILLVHSVAASVVFLHY